MISVTGKRTEMQRDGFSGNRIAGGNGAKRSCQSGRREHTDPARQDPIVYVIDGDGPTRQRLFELVDTMNLSCATFDSAQAFLEQCEPDRAGCVVTELKLPDLSGPQLQQELRSRGASHPIIVLTAYPDLSLAVRRCATGPSIFWRSRSGRMTRGTPSWRPSNWTPGSGKSNDSGIRRSSGRNTWASEKGASCG